MNNKLLNSIMNELRLLDKEFLVLLTLDLIEIKEENLVKIQEYKKGLIGKLKEDVRSLDDAIELKSKEYIASVTSAQAFGTLNEELHELKQEKDRLIDQIERLEGGE